MIDITPAKFSDNYDPIGKIQIDDEVYDVFPPDTLKERYYIHYYDARSEIMEIVQKYQKVDEEGRVLGARDAKSVGRMEVEMIKPARHMIEALFELEPDTLSVRPKTVINIYNKVEEFLNDHYKALQEESEEDKDTPQPKKQSNTSKTKKNSSKSTSKASSTTTSSS
jgi:hypothetical protein